MFNTIRLFWDSSAIIDALLARETLPYYELFELAAAGTLDMRISSDVMRECEGVLRPRNREILVLLALVLDEARFATTPKNILEKAANKSRDTALLCPYVNLAVS